MNPVKHIITALLLLCWCSLLNAQEEEQPVRIRWGIEYKEPGRSQINKIIHTEGKTFYVARVIPGGLFSDDKLWLEKYEGNQSEMAFSKEINYPEIKEREVEIQNIIYFHHQLWLIASHYDQSLKTKTLLAYRINAQGVVGDSPAQLHIAKGVTASAISSYGLAQSEDNAAMVITTYESPNYSYSDKAAFTVLDTNFNKQWSKEIRLPFKNKLADVKKIKLDTADNVFLLLKVSDKQDMWSRGEAAYKYSLVAYYHEEKEVKEYAIDLPEKPVVAIKFNFNPEGNIVIGGLFSRTTESRNKIAGCFYVVIDARTKAVKVAETNSFSNEFLAEFLTPRQIEKQKQLENFKFNYFVPLENGGAFLTAEENYENTVCVTDPRTGAVTCTDHYHFNDIIVMYVNYEGQLEWARKIPKKQHSVNDGGPYSSYVVGYSHRNLVILFNDHPKNTEGVFPEYVKNMPSYKRAVTVSSRIDYTGKVLTRNITDETRDYNVLVRPRIYTRLSLSEMIIYGEGRRNYTFGWIAF